MGWGLTYPRVAESDRTRCDPLKQWVLRNPLQTAGSQCVIIPPTVTTLRGSERALILATLEAVGWVIGGAKGAAAKLGLKCTTLICKMQKLGIYRSCLQSSQM
jgi:transcriptional regulator with GAF, ATPase, and Fis domain